MDYPFASLFFLSLGVTLVMMPVARIVGVRMGLLDHPAARKVQRTAVPRTGGIGILFGLLAGTALLAHYSSALGIPMTRELVAIFVGGVLLHITGVLDDLFSLPARLKLFAQVLSVGIVVSQGVVVERIDILGGGVLDLGPFAAPLTVFFLVGFINSINLVDGLDGLASGIVAIGALSLALFGLTDGNYLLAALATVLFGSVVGFLPFNFLRHKTFLGDSGSMLLGYMLGVVAIAGSWFSGESTPIALVLACAFLPILDTVTTILRRYRKGQAIFLPDSMHLHHRLIRFGLSPRRTVLILLALTLFFAGQSLVLFGGLRALVLTTSLAIVFVVLQIHQQRKHNQSDKSDPGFDTGFREILFYLLGAQDGPTPRMDGGVSLNEILRVASRDAAAEATLGAPVLVSEGVASGEA
jgi:UDP-GlcNAc:undecaprenyl-phosphate GlcNAc-1-phosphate transferase